MKGETKNLNELDLIGIVGGTNALCTLVGNYNCFVYRLCKYNSKKIAVIEIDDTETSEISDTGATYELSDDSDVICLDDSKQELDIHLSDQFNKEIKKEIQELDELEAHCIQLKKEPSDFFAPETIDDIYNEINNIPTVELHQALDNNNSELIQYDSDDSIRLVIDEQDVRSIEFVDVENASSKDDNNSPTDRLNGSLEKSGNNPLTNDQTKGGDSWLHYIDTDSEDKLQRAVMKVSDRTEPIKQPQILDPKRLQHRRKTMIYNYQQSSKPKPLISGVCKENMPKPQNSSVCTEQHKPKPQTSTVTKKYTPTPQTSAAYKEYRKDKLKNLSAAKRKPVVEKEKVKITPKVKITLNNRGTFLTDPSQRPVLPKDIKICRRKSVLLSKPCFSSAFNA